MKKNIWILNHYSIGMMIIKSGRHYYFADCLKKAGYSPVVFGSNSMHNRELNYVKTDALWTEKNSEDIGIPYIVVKSRTYKNNETKRILNMIDFYRNVQKAGKQYAQEHGKPDIIYASSVHPLTLVAGIKLAKHFGIKCICEVRDLWPESILEYSPRWKKSNPLIKLLYKGEKWIYKKADAMVYTMEGAYDYITEKGWDKEIPRSKVYYINNGTDLELYDQNVRDYPTSDPDLDNENIFKVVYCGSIRKVNNVGKLLDIAKAVRNPKIRFLIWGSGDQLDALKKRKETEHIDNVVFKDRVEKKYIPYITSKANLNFAHNDASKMLMYGISFNKLFEYLAAGKPVLFDFESRYNPAIQENAGIEVTSGKVEDIAAAIDEISQKNTAELEAIGRNARAAASKYDFKVLTDKLISIIESI